MYVHEEGLMELDEGSTESENSYIVFGQKILQASSEIIDVLHLYL
jgi:hypothetical protein